MMQNAKTRYRAWILALSVVTAGLLHHTSVAWAHGGSPSRVEHRSMMTVGATSIDVEIELVFHPAASLAERRRMDGDQDATITNAEVEEYLSRMAGKLQRGAGLAVDGRLLHVMPLYGPELDLLGLDQVAPSPHVLRLFYFARTPEWLAPDDQIVLEDSLWPSAPAVCVFDVSGKQGARVFTIPGSDPSNANEVRPVMAARCVAVPISVAVGSLVSNLAVPVVTATDERSELPPRGAVELAGKLARHHPYLFDAAGRETLGEINRQLREAESLEDRAETAEAKRTAASRLSAAAGRLDALLRKCPSFIQVPFSSDRPTLTSKGPVPLPGDVGALLFRVEAGRGPTRYVTTDIDMSNGPVTDNAWVMPVEVASSGTTWALVGLSNVPTQQTSLLLEFRGEAGTKVRLPIDVETPEQGRLKLTILSADTGKPAPAMVRLVWKTDRQDRKPSNAVELALQFDNQSEGMPPASRRFANLPGRVRGHYWCVPGPIDMVVPPGEWEIAIRRGLEHVPIFDTFTVEPGHVVEKTYRPRRWVDMPKLGWYSGDDHVHCRILSDADAERLMAWVQAEDVHLANIVKMGDINRTWFEQRGFGKQYRVVDGDYVLSPGQECPRTHDQLGHTVSMNTTSMVRDTDKYYLYDWMFDTVHAQGGLCGYAHILFDWGFHVHRGMSIDVPRGKVDFAEVLQFGQLGTDLYYDFLNTGFKVTASAGSDVPYGGTIGEVRMYAYVGDEPFSADTWFEAVRRGRTFVTNGPMIELHVDEAMPGDEIAVTGDRKLRVRARAWGDPERLVPTRLEIVRHGEVIRRVTSPDGSKRELTLDFEVDAGCGSWIAARADSSDGSKAHTTPVYVVREPLRFWKFDAVDRLIAKRLASLAEVEGIVATAQERNDAGQVEDNRTIKQLALQGPELLKRVAAARLVYEDLKQVAAQEHETDLRKQELDRRKKDGVQLVAEERGPGHQRKLQQLERELERAREAGNHAEAKEIQTLINKIKANQTPDGEGVQDEGKLTDRQGRVAELQRELEEARKQGNRQEVEEIQELLKRLKTNGETVGRAGAVRRPLEEDEGPQPVQPRIRALEREIESAREAGDELEVEEIQELMARLTSRIRDEETSATPHVDTIEVNVDSVSNVKISSAACGFALAYSGTAKSQLAIMEPAGILVGSVATDEVITVVVQLARVEEPFEIRAVAEVWDGRDAAVSFSLNESDASWHRLGNAPTPLEANGQPRDDAATLFIKMKSSKGQTAIRLAHFELTTDGETYPMTLPVSTLSVEQFPRPELPAMYPGIERALIEWDWRMQDGITTEREPRTYDQAIGDTLKRGDALIQHLVRDGISIDEVKVRWKGVRQQWRQLQALSSTSETAWENLWRKVHLLRRKIVLQNPLADTGPIAFVKCVPTNNSIMQLQYIGRFARPAGGIFVLEEPGKSMRCRELTEGKLPGGAYQHLDVSYDGSRVLFSFCKLDNPPEDAYQGNPGHHYNIYEIQADGSGLRPLIVSSHDDITPRYLPDGNIAFVSTRRGGYSRCGPDFAPCHTLALADADGANQRLISFHEVHEYDPAVMNDGRIVYTRWDYVDREASLYQQLWITRPDGTNPAIYYGNNTFNPMATFEPRAVPGSNYIMAIAGCHHSIAAGSVVLVNIRKGVDGLAPLERLTPDALFPETEARIRGRWDVPEEFMLPQVRRWPHNTYKSPLPLSEDVFLVSYSFDRLVYDETEPNPANMFGLYLVDRFGNKELLYRDLNVSSVWPMPLHTRPCQNQLPEQSDPAAPKASTFYVQNVYEADPPLPKDVKITQLRIVHVFPRTSKFETYPVIGIPTAACGRQVLGTIPVEPDGSAYFKAPSGVALAFQALDELGQSVQFMRSVTYLQPGENTSCVGCHEHRMSAPPDLPMGLAIRRAPSRIRPGPEGSKPLSYPLLVQPVLDKHCVECHGGERIEGDVVLTGEVAESEDGDRSPFSLSYLALAPLVKYAQWPVMDEDFRVSNSEPITQPDFFGSRSSPLIAMLREGHEGVELNDEEFERLITWADNNVLFYGTFDPEDQARQLRGERIEGPLVD